MRSPESRRVREGADLLLKKWVNFVYTFAGTLKLMLLLLLYYFCDIDHKNGKYMHTTAAVKL